MHLPKIATVTAMMVLPLPARAQGQLPEMPRSDVVASYYLGFSFGPASLDAQAKRRAAAGPGYFLGLTLGIGFWKEFPLNAGFGSFFLKDRQPFSEWVVTCTSYDNTELGCSEPAEEYSKLIGTYFSIDGGYQPRLKIVRGFTVLPGALIGYLWNGGFEKAIQCDGCASIPIDGVTAAGAFLAPALRMVLGDAQFFSLSARYQWFVSGSLTSMALFGFEFLAP